MFWLYIAVPLYYAVKMRRWSSVGPPCTTLAHGPTVNQRWANGSCLLGLHWGPHIIIIFIRWVSCNYAPDWRRCFDPLPCRLHLPSSDLNNHIARAPEKCRQIVLYNLCAVRSEVVDDRRLYTMYIILFSKGIKFAVQNQEEVTAYFSSKQFSFWLSEQT